MAVESTSQQQQHPQPDIVYTPESALGRPVLLWREMWHDLWHSRELAWRLARRDISARYRQSALGIVWAFVPPIVTTLTFVFLNGAGIINIGETTLPYPVHVLFGTVLWTLFEQSIKAPLATINSSRVMLGKLNFPRESLMLAAMLKVLFDFGIRAGVLLVIMVLYGIPLTVGILLAPFAALAIMFLGFTLGLLLTPVGSLYTDVFSGLGILTSFWFYVTPVVYPVPADWPWVLLVYLNPVSPLLESARELATGQPLTYVEPFFLVVGLTFIGMLFAWVLYRVSMPIVVERIST